MSKLNNIKLVNTVSQVEKEADIFNLLVKIGNATNDNAAQLFTRFINYGVGNVTSQEEMKLLHDKMLLAIKSCDTMTNAAKTSSRAALGNNLKSWTGYIYMRANHVAEFNKAEAENNTQPRRWYNVMLAKKKLAVEATENNSNAKSATINATDKHTELLIKEYDLDRAAIIEVISSLIASNATLATYKTELSSLVTKLQLRTAPVKATKATKQVATATALNA